MGSSQSSSSSPGMRHFRHQTTVRPRTRRPKEKTKPVDQCNRGTASKDWLEILLCSVLATKPSHKTIESSENKSTLTATRRFPSGGSGSTVSNDSTSSYGSPPSSPISSLSYQEQGRDHPRHPKVLPTGKHQASSHATAATKRNSQSSDIIHRVEKHYDLLSESLKMTCSPLSSPLSPQNNLANNPKNWHHNQHHNQYQQRGREECMGDSSDSRSISSDPTTHMQEGLKRSRSPALPCRSNKRRHSWSFDTSEARSCDEEARIADLARMYDRATWRMYDRIMKARARSSTARNPIMMVPAPHHHQQLLDRPIDINATYVSNTCVYPSEDGLAQRDNRSHSIEEFPFSFEMDH